MPGTKSYLHPTQRSLKTEQIGPSSHKNEYRKGVLLGNWAEDKLPKGSQVNYAMPRSTQTEEFNVKPGNQRYLIRTPDTGRDLLFGHNEKKRPGMKQEEHVKPPPVIPKFDAKRKQWNEDLDPDTNLMRTAKSQQMDSVGEAIFRDKQVLHDSSIKTGVSFTGQFVQDHRHMSLRVYPKQ